jgi:hypothetical protein
MLLCYTWAMLKALTWCVKCLFLYLFVVVAALRYSWILTTPIWQLADKMHWTQLNCLVFVLSYFLPIFPLGFAIESQPSQRRDRLLRSKHKQASALVHSHPG